MKILLKTENFIKNLLETGNLRIKLETGNFKENLLETGNFIKNLIIGWKLYKEFY